MSNFDSSGRKIEMNMRFLRTIKMKLSEVLSNLKIIYYVLCSVT